MNRQELLLRIGFASVAAGSVIWSGVPVARHMAGVVALEPLPAVTMPVPRAQMDLNLEPLFALAPFGRQPVTNDLVPANREDRPDIVLRGIFATRDATSTALLDVNGTAGLYKPDMRVADVFVLARITPELVELRDADGSLILRFDEEVEETSDQPEALAAAGPSLLERVKGDVVVATGYERPGQPETTVEYIDYWRQRVRKNPQAVLDDIGLRATTEGYVIAERHDVGVRLAGLRTGDLVRTVNGQKVGDPEADRRFYDEIAASGEARIEVERNGRLLSFSFPLR